MHKAFFIDKDGTLVDNSQYPDVIPSDDLLKNDVIEGLKYLQQKGYKLFIVSNQPWVAKGRLSLQEVEDIFSNLLFKLNKFGVKIDDVVFCPHQMSDFCDCKKPKTKLVIDLINKYSINLSESFFVGDMEADIRTGKNAGLKTILVKTGCGNNYQSELTPDHIIKNLNDVGKVV